MRLKNEKKAGFTLAEVLISITIFSLMIIPAMNLITTSLKNMRNTSENEKAEILGKQIMEEIKAINLESLKESKVLTSGIVLYKNLDGSISTIKNDEGNIDFQTINNGYSAKVIIEKNKNVSYQNISENMDAEFNIYSKNKDIFIQDINDINGENIRKLNMTNYNSDKIIITNEYNLSSDFNFISIKLNSMDVIKIKKTKKSNEYNKETGYIKFNLLDNEENIDIERYINIDVKNLMKEDFNIYISKDENSFLKTNIDLDNNTVGSMLITEDSFTQNKVGNLCKISVVVQKDNKELFNISGYKNMNL